MFTRGNVRFFNGNSSQCLLNLVTRTSCHACVITVARHTFSEYVGGKKERKKKKINGAVLLVYTKVKTRYPRDVTRHVRDKETPPQLTSFAVYSITISVLFNGIVQMLRFLRATEGSGCESLLFRPTNA